MFLKNHIDLTESSYRRAGCNFSGDGPVSDEIRRSAGTVSRRRKLTAGDAHDQIFMPAHALSEGEEPNHHKSPTEAKSPASPHTFLPEVRLCLSGPECHLKCFSVLAGLLLNKRLVQCH